MEKLLLIDDEPGIRSTIQSILQSEELQVFVAADAAEGLYLMKKECPPIVMLDIRLGSESGLDIFDQLRLVNPRVLVIFITGHGTTETAIETMKLGAYDYLVKPLDLDTVLASVARNCSHCARHATFAKYAGETMAPMASESLRERLARLEAKGLSEADLKTLTADLDALESKHAGGGH